jgi:hypothetical protein
MLKLQETLYNNLGHNIPHVAPSLSHSLTLDSQGKLNEATPFLLRPGPASFNPGALAIFRSSDRQFSSCTTYTIPLINPPLLIENQAFLANIIPAYRSILPLYLEDF